MSLYDIISYVNLLCDINFDIIVNTSSPPHTQKHPYYVFAPLHVVATRRYTFLDLDSMLTTIKQYIQISQHYLYVIVYYLYIIMQFDQFKVIEF